MYPKNRAAPAVLCTGTSSKTGQPCRRAPIRGGTVCASHGGLAPHVRAAAAARLANASLGMVGVLREIALDSEVAAADRIRAANSMLDRAGLRAGVEIEVTAKTWEHVLDGVLVDVDVEDAEEVGPGERATRSAIAAPLGPDEREADLAAERASAKVRQLRQKSANAEAKRRSR
jgi:hypothetical protein